jgi:hypothetical protein
MLEAEHIGEPTHVTVIPNGVYAGAVWATEGALRPLTPRKLRAAGRAIAAGFLAARLAGFDPPPYSGSDDARKLGLAAYLSKDEPNFIRQCWAGAELQLRMHWSAVERVAELLRTLGELTPPHGIELVRMALEAPARPLAPDIDTLMRLCRELEDVPEFAKQFETAARALSASVG